MKLVIKITLCLLLIICLFTAAFPTGAAKFTSLSRNPAYNYGVDVSQWNGDLDWDLLRSRSVEFAFIRIGYYHTGKGYLDTRFKQNIKACVEAGIDFGVYVYSYVYSHSETVKCAKWVCDVLDSMGNYTKDKDIIPVAYDIEDEIQKNAVYYGRVSRSYMHNGVQKFCDTVRSNGYEPVVYSFASFFNDFLYLNKFQDEGIRIWYASWPYKPNIKVKKKMDNGTYADIWQFSSTCTIGSTLFDADVCYNDFYDYSKEDSNLDIVGLKSSYSCKKSGVKPDIKVYSDGTLLKKGTDYKVFYYKNKQTGRARMKIVRYKNGKYFESKTVPFIIKPVTVKNLKAMPSTNQIDLVWDKLSGAVSYQIEEYNSENNKFNVIDTVKTNSYSYSLLDEGREYKLRVRAGARIDGKIVYGSYSEVTAATFYKAVKLNSLSLLSKSKVKLKWTAKKSDTKGYIVEYSTNKDFRGRKRHKITKKTVDNAVISKLKSGEKYYFRVRSYNYKNAKYFFSLYSKVKSLTIK